ncbi:MBOAT, membrane-bound O-acyltransferase family-domain-containing protein [Scheffersomyces xylosifermentans]|uniref:MBOAT, membrane-bound O-acyltransferase family-domain-containing protein n=1 Tax=Scheffersomyces xylosifermentans TaxID=1304137 RepID=UPI00315DB6AD
MPFQFVQTSIAQLSDATGLDVASLKILICTLLSFPFGVIFKRLPDQHYTLKNVYNVTVSAFYVFGILNLRSGILTLFISAMGCYFITRYLRTSAMPWVNFLFLMLHLCYSHLHTQFFVEYDPTIIDITGAQMVLVMKLSAFGWNIHDGKQPKASLTQFAQERVVKKHPNLLPYIGYVFFYASLLTGPAFDYADYDKFIHSTLFDDVPDSKRPGKRKRRIPRSGVQSFKKTMQGFFWAIILLQLPKYVNLPYVLSGEFYANHNFIYRIFYLWILGFGHRLKYYTIWLIAEGACILCGLGYNGYDTATDTFKWDRVQNIDPWAFETGQNVHACLEAWNMNTNKWLKNYVYLRIARKGKKPGFKSTLFTFVTSAFWHGTRPGYYLTFVLGAVLQTVGKIYRRNLRPIFLEADGKTPKPSKKLYDFACYLGTQLAFGFISQPFVILDFRKSVYCWYTCYFYITIISVVTIFVFKGPYGKVATRWCQSHSASYQAQNASDNKRKLSIKETEAVVAHVENMLEKDRFDTLGLPPIDVLETVDKEEIDENIKELTIAWKSFRERRGSIKEDDFEGLKDAYNNFTNEINEIFLTKKEEILKKAKEEPKKTE